MSHEFVRPKLVEAPGGSREQSIKYVTNWRAMLSGKNAFFVSAAILFLAASTVATAGGASIAALGLSFLAAGPGFDIFIASGDKRDLNSPKTAKNFIPKAA